MRHLSRSKKKYWHIDYLTTANSFKPLALVYIETLKDLEEIIAWKLTGVGIFHIAFPRFGSMDKRSPTHLFKCNSSLNSCINKLAEIFKQYGEPRAIFFTNSTYS